MNAGQEPQPVIQSLLDLDFYKLTMLQFIWRRHRDVPVTFTFKNRTADVQLAQFVRLEDLTRELNHVSGLRITDEELAYLASLKTFDHEFLSWLAAPGLLPMTLGRVGAAQDGQLRIEVSGPWSQVTLWETIVLAIVNELYYRAITPTGVDAYVAPAAVGTRRLDEKVAILRQRRGIKVIEFGTRRRYSNANQRYVLERLKDEVPANLLGTSNVLLAKELGLKPIGTFAHELDMVYSGIYRDRLYKSHRLMLRDWWEEYGGPLSIALTDTYTSDFFFEDFTAEQAWVWRGFRQDSGDPFAFAGQAIAFYRRHGVDPMTKTIIFSDGLDVEKIVRLASACDGLVGCSFGWGTDLTNDVGFRPLSLVMKVTAAAGHGTVKLSDNLAKAQGSPEDIALFTRTFGHAPTTREECKY
ncbi:nicotinate phosphoribosyltransferase [Candidatus Uhrbacteria bacterium]|nr:nicotinate phosphoribosyltransferase [Candidatus Uhrbacteria bacterium]